MAYHGCNCIPTVVSFGLYTSDVACLRYSKHAITFVGKRPGRPTAQQGQRPEDPTFKACFDGPAEASKGRLVFCRNCDIMGSAYCVCSFFLSLSIILHFFRIAWSKSETIVISVCFFPLLPNPLGAK